jgi:hypothetical protein
MRLMTELSQSKDANRELDKQKAEVCAHSGLQRRNC